MEKENQELQQEVVKILTASNKDLETKLETSKLIIKELDEKVSMYESSDLDIMKSTLKEYESLGTPESVAETVTKSESAVIELQSYKAIHESAEELNDVLAQSELVLGKVYESFKGQNIEQVLAKMELLTKYESFGPVDQIESVISRAESLLTDYSEIGTPEEIRSILARSESFISQVDSMFESKEELFQYATDKKLAKHEAQLKEVVAECGVTQARAELALTKFESTTDAIAFLKEMFPKRESAEEVLEDEEQASESAIPEAGLDASVVTPTHESKKTTVSFSNRLHGLRSLVKMT